MIELKISYFTMAFIIIILLLHVYLMIYFYTKNRAIKRKTKDIVDTLLDISNENPSHRLLARNDELLAPLCYSINDIIQKYQYQIYELQKKDLENRHLMTSLSHDIRTPLTTILGYLDAIRNNIVTGLEKDKYIEITRTRANDMKNYINAMFDWFKLNSDDYDFNYKNININEFVRDILVDWIPIFEKNKIDYEINIPEKYESIYADEESVRRIVNNLIQNVIVHSKASKITLETYNENKNIIVMVKDNGIGISKQDLPHIFERLYKCDYARTDKSSGLGLSIAYQLARKMNSNIVISSKPNIETKFMIKFVNNNIKTNRDGRNK